LLNSKSVSTTSVLASVAIAHPKVIEKLIFPVLKIKEVYKWDLIRCTHEHGLNHASFIYEDLKIPFAQEERINSDKLPHRQKDLESLVTTLQTSGHWDDINSILDGFYQQVDREPLWSLALNRMDFRKYVVDKSIEPIKEGYVALRPKIDEDLKEMVNINNQEMELGTSASNMTTWSRKIFENQDKIEKDVEKWKYYFKEYSDVIDKSRGFIKFMTDPTHLAAIGIRDFFENLDKKHQDWCIKKLLDVLIAKISEDDPFKASDIPALYYKEAFDIIPLILTRNVSKSTKIYVKELLYSGLLHLNNNKHIAQEFRKSFREKLWDIDEKYANDCFYALLLYAKIWKAKPVYVDASSFKDKKNLQKIEEDLFKKVLTNDVKIEISDISFNEYSHWFIGYALTIIPFNTDNTLYHDFYKKVFYLLYSEMSKQERGHDDRKIEYIDIKHEFQIHFAHYLLCQPVDKSTQVLIEILSFVINNSKEKRSFDALEFVQGILKYIIIIEDHNRYETFPVLWETFGKCIVDSGKSYFINYLFLSIEWNSNSEDWYPLKYMKSFYEKYIPLYGHQDIEAVANLFAHIGTKELLPEGIVWLSTALKKCLNPLEELQKNNCLFYCEKLSQRLYYRNLTEIKASKELRDEFLYLLDNMLNVGSSLAFIIRDRIIAA
jgi:hypothetical protein